MPEDYVLAYRIELEGRGPFWNERAFHRMVRECRKVTPEWKVESPGCSSFMEHYIANAESPHDNPQFDQVLSRVRMQEGSLGFGFVSRQALEYEFNLANPIYKRQMLGVLERCPQIRLRIYSVKPVALSETECLFRWNQAQHLQTISTGFEFENV